ncbi:MAG TPA: replicative DNA helicase [Thioploca sp.]|nr:replicative DNA helicase [Thioploca sp.]
MPAPTYPGVPIDNAVESLKTPPFSREAEQSVLGGLMLNNEAWISIADLLTETDFYQSEHQILFRAIKSLSEEGHPCDPVTLSEWLQRHNQLDAIGGGPYLGLLASNTPSAANIVAYAEIVRDRSILRQMVRVGTNIMESAFNTQGRKTTQLLDNAEKMVFEIAELGARGQGGFVKIDKVLTDTLARIDILSQQEGNITGIPTNFNEFDNLTSGLQSSDLIIVAGRPSMGKCIASDCKIVLADGSLATIADIYQRQKAQLLTLGQDYQFLMTQPTDFIDDGIKPVFRVTTQLGRVIETTLTHPFLTLQGWHPLSEITVGDKIAVPRKIEVFGKETLRECQIKLLAYLIGDGNLTGSQPRLTNSHPQIQKDFIGAVEQFKNPLTQGLEELLGLWEKNAKSKLIPSIVFKLQPAQIALFLNRLFAINGWASVLHRGQVQLGYCNDCYELIRQVQHLLLRFGIIASIKQCTINHSHRQAWQLDILDAESLQIFIDKIGIFAKEKALSEIQAAISNNQSNHNPISTDIREQIAWDEIKAIEPIGFKQVYDLTIPNTHNFVANDICVHNTSFAMNIAEHVAVELKIPVAVFSMEMSDEQLAMRLISSLAKVNLQNVRTGILNDDQWDQITRAVSQLESAPLFIDDTPALSPTELRARVRRLAREHGKLGLVVIDYLQLMQVPDTKESRANEVSEISRSLKSLAKELNVPVMALSQLNRSLEQRTDKRPKMSDLRESGCLHGDSLVTCADTGARVLIRDLVGRTDFYVWGLNTQTMRLERAKVSRAFCTGIKPVFRLTTRLGRTIRATGNHKFYTPDGWKRLDELKTGDYLALPRRIPAPKKITPKTEAELALLGHLIGDGCTLPTHAIQYTTREKDLAELVAQLAVEIFGSFVAPRINAERSWFQVYLSSTRQHTHGVKSVVSEWLDRLGILGLRSYEKRVPKQVFQQSNEGVATFLRHLWVTDGCICLNKIYPNVYYATSSYHLAFDIQSLLLRLGINARVSRVPQPNKGRDQYHVILQGQTDILRFADLVGTVGEYKTQSLAQVREFFGVNKAISKRDVIPNNLWKKTAVMAMQQVGMTHAQFCQKMGTSDSSQRLIFTHNLTRERALRVANALQSDELKKMAQSDIYWDRIATNEPAGEEKVFDLTVPTVHNFTANNLTVSNSIEQDSDLIVFIYRDEVYNEDSPDKGLAEIIIAKQRNGPIGTRHLSFRGNLTKFENSTPNDSYYGE